MPAIKAKPINFHNECLMVAETMWRRHIVSDDGEKCFNLFTFLESLSTELDCRFADNLSPAGRFSLDATDVARYLWCHMALNSGDSPDGNTFRGMPILD